MTLYKIKIFKNDFEVIARVETTYDDLSEQATVKIYADDIINEVVVDIDYFACLFRIRRILEIKGYFIMCYGARKDVYPSRMSRDMSKGLMAYILIMGKPTSNEDIVNIFDSTSKENIVSLDQQEKYYRECTSNE